jgi:hypothetical protein
MLASCDEDGQDASGPMENCLWGEAHLRYGLDLAAVHLPRAVHTCPRIVRTRGCARLPSPLWSVHHGANQDVPCEQDYASLHVLAVTTLSIILDQIFKLTEPIFDVLAFADLV